MTASAATETTEAFDPSALLNALHKQLDLKNDAALARVLEVQPPVISKLRHSRMPVGATILIAMHEVSGLSIGELRALMGDRRAKFRDPAAARPTSAQSAPQQ